MMSVHKFIFLFLFLNEKQQPQIMIAHSSIFIINFSWYFNDSCKHFTNVTITNEKFSDSFVNYSIIKQMKKWVTNCEWNLLPCNSICTCFSGFLAFFRLNCLNDLWVLFFTCFCGGLVRKFVTHSSFFNVGISMIYSSEKFKVMLLLNYFCKIFRIEKFNFTRN